MLIDGALKPLTNGANNGAHDMDGAGAETFVFNLSLGWTVGATFSFRPDESGRADDRPNVSANKQP